MIQTTFDFSANSQLPVAVLRAVGELGKERGMRLAADVRTESVAAGQIAFLFALLKSPDGTATIDDSTCDLATKFDDGGKWRGAIPSGLARRRVVERIGVAKSDRPSRHRGFVSRWRLLNRGRAERELERLLATLAPKENPQAAATAAGSSESQTPNTEGTRGATS